MKIIFRSIILILLVGLLTGCDHLDFSPQGSLDEEQIDEDQVDKLLMAAYAAIGNDEINRPLSLWNYGNVRSDDAYKGGRGVDDGEPLHTLEVCQSIDPASWYQNGFWAANYDAISRTKHRFTTFKGRVGR